MSQANSNNMDEFGGALEYDANQVGEEMPQVAPAPSYRKRGVDVYTLFLIISLICLIAGTIFLFTNVGQYQLR